MVILSLVALSFVLSFQMNPETEHDLVLAGLAKIDIASGEMVIAVQSFFTTELPAVHSPRLRQVDFLFAMFSEMEKPTMAGTNG